ncbi:caspase family protein [Polyangium jinanense]|uniref:Caspase family protein n=1 Tax=Polyangium jinanense TaxID=2829994 RepID=A0A9X3X0G1_9BACT|nr:caspase family protein [Polyangium jinanense]MDC3955178.1 caspase family protein [Polyangium jinanense]MDC3981479.1 caspase family protein [Polyangium jinanense]
MFDRTRAGDASEASPRFHVLLVGIDAYPRVDPLYGCVNDVDALEALLLDRLSVPADSITKLVAPHPGSSRRPRLPEGEPTSENLRAALEALAGEGVRPGDRVFIHYSGHGTQVLPRGTRTAREALVPVDALAGGELLFDHWINDVLRRIAARTDDLTVVLDCCCSAGATRSAWRPRESAVRFCSIEELQMLPSVSSRSGGEARAGLFASFDPSDPGFLVVASAQSGEAASEGKTAGGVRHGAFTAGLLDLLAAESDERLRVLRWADLWQNLRARVTSAFPGQHPCLLGRSERRLFGGPFRRQDPGYAITREGERYRIHAGTMVGLTAGAKVAVYGPSPEFFPPLHSPEDRAARRGLLQVESATASSALASSVGAAFVLDEAARGRLVAPGKGDALVVGLDPFDADLSRWLSAEASLFSVAAVSAHGEREVEAVVGRAPDGRFWIGDDVHGFGAGASGDQAPLAWVPAGDRAALVQGLLHHARYKLPLRLVRRCRDWPGVLRVRVLDARDVGRLDLEELADPPLPEAEPDPDGRYRYRLLDGQPVCFSVENRSSEPMYAQVLNCASSGRVEILGTTQLEIAPWRRQTFWMSGHLGRAFPCRVSAGRESNVDRLVVVGTASPEVDLRFLRVKESFAEAIGRSTREMMPDEEAPAERWTATLVTVEIVRGIGGP